MKCPKCNFTSFDYNSACPKCGKDLTPERDLMNLPSYKPKPLSLSGPLTIYSEVPDSSGAIDQMEWAQEKKEASEELLIPIDDFSDDKITSTPTGSDSVQAEPELTIDDGISLELDHSYSEELKLEKDHSWEPEALEEKAVDMQLGDASKNEPDILIGEEAPIETDAKESIFQFELEPLEFDLELEEPDKNAS